MQGVRSWAFWDTLLQLTWALIAMIVVIALMSFYLPFQAALPFSPEALVPFVSCSFVAFSVARLLATRPLIGHRWPLYMLFGQLMASWWLYVRGVTTPNWNTHIVQHWLAGTPAALLLWAARFVFQSKCKPRQKPSSFIITRLHAWRF